MLHRTLVRVRSRTQPRTDALLREMTPAEWVQIVELPRSIAKLKAVGHLILYGSSLV